MATRRGFLASILATASLPSLTWADAGGPALIAAGKEPYGNYGLIGLTDIGEDVFTIPLTARGHAGAGHPTRPEAVAFARRPGTFALMIDCAFGRDMHRLEASNGVLFSGLGVFGADGKTLYTSETKNEGGAGRIGVWDADQSYTRNGSFSSAALDEERTKLNLDTMEPNLSYLTSEGEALERVSLSESLRKSSIRHLAVAVDGTVGFAMHWEGDTSTFPPLLGLHERGSDCRLVTLPDQLSPRLKNYAAGVSFGSTGNRVAMTCPKGGVMISFDRRGADPTIHERRDICGLGPAQTGFFATDGLGGLL